MSVHVLRCIFMLLTVYRKIFGTSSYGEGCTSLSASPPYERVPNILRYRVNNLFIIYLLNSNLRLVVIISCTTKSFRPFILPQKTSKPLLTAVMHDINAHAKPRLLARND